MDPLDKTLQLWLRRYGSLYSELEEDTLVHILLYFSTLLASHWALRVWAYYSLDLDLHPLDRVSPCVKEVTERSLSLPQWSQLKITQTNAYPFFRLGKTLSVLHLRCVTSMDFFCILSTGELVNEATNGV